MSIEAASGKGPADPPVTHRRVLAVALPIVLSNATVPILGAVDTGVVGQMGEAAPIGAVGVGAVILSALYWVFGFLRMGTTGLVGQAAGRGDGDEVSALLTRALLIAGAAGLALIALQVPLFAGAFVVAPASAEVESLAETYLAIRIWSAPFAIAVFGLTGWLIAQERTRAVLVLQVAMNGVNILLDLWFVLGLGWGVAGVAAATVVAEATGAVLGLWFCREAFGNPAWRDWARVLDPVRLRVMAAVNADILLRSLLLQAIFVSFLLLASDIGDVRLAATQVLLQFVQIASYALDGFAFAVEALVARAFGAGRLDRLRRSARLASVWALGAGCLFSLGFAAAGGAIIDLMTTAAEVREAARLYLPWVLLSTVVGVPAYMLDGIFIGATRTKDMRNMMLLSALIYAGAVAMLMPTLGAHGLWAALLIHYVARGATLGARYPALERAVTGARGAG
mgnify:FL=1